MSGADPGEARRAAVAAALEAAGITVMEFVELEYRDRYTLVVGLDKVATDVLYNRSEKIIAVQARGISASANEGVESALSNLRPEVVSPVLPLNTGVAAAIEAVHRAAFEAAGLTVIDAHHAQYLITYTIDDADGRSANLKVSYNDRRKVTPHKRAPASDAGVWQAAVDALGLQEAPQVPDPAAGAVPPDEEPF